MARRITTRPTEVSLRELFPTAEYLHVASPKVTGVAVTPRQCTKGCAYVVLDDANDDPMQAAALALHSGATVIITEQLLPLSSAPQCIVKDARAAYAQLCYGLQATAIGGLHKVGVTGTHGKTCATWLIASVLGNKAGSGFYSTLGRSTSNDFAPEQPTKDVPRGVSAWFAECAKAGAKHAVLEVSSLAIAQQQLAGLLLDCAVVTNFSRDGFDEHSTLDNYRDTLRRICESLKPGGTLVVNLDDALGRDLARDAGMPTLTIGLNETADVTAKLLERSPSEQTFLLTAGPESVAVRTQFVGDAMLYHCLSAAAVGLLQGMQLTEIARGLETVDKLPGRLERIECGQPFTVFTDAASEPESLRMTLETAREVSTGRVYCVFGAEPTRSRDQLHRLGQTIEAHTDQVVITHDQPNSGACAEAALEILTGFECLKHVTHIGDRREAIEQLLAKCQPGDVLVVAGARNAPFPGFSMADDDRDLIEPWLRALETKNKSAKKRA